MADLFSDGEECECAFYPSRNRATVGKKIEDTPSLSVISRGVTLDRYAEAKTLPIEFLRDLGLSDAKRDNQPALRIP